jgi:Lysozyme like domain
LEPSILPSNVTSNRRSRTRPLGDGVSSKLTVDTSQITSLTLALDGLSRKITSVRRDLVGLEKDATAAGGALGGAAGVMGTGRSGGGFVSGGSTPRPPSFTNSSIGGGGAGGGGAFGRLGSLASSPIGRGIAAGAVAAGVGGAVRSIDNRVDRGMEYASSASKLNVLTQQMYGLSEQQALAMREPYRNYKLGQGAINSSIQFQTRTGYDISGMAGSMEGIRALSGWTLSTQDIIAQQEALLQPQVANSLFTNMGISPFQVGGGMKDPMAFRNEILARTGLLNDPNRLKGAFQPGSVMRSNMTQAGIPVELQDQLLQQAQTQQSYRAKGGFGTYTGTAAQREFMGVEGTFATEQEETERLRVAREEQFMDRQIDNFAALERNTQKMVELLGNIEDSLSGAIGARTGIRGNPIARGIGGALQVAGLAGAVAGGPVGWGLGAAAMGLGTLLSGDPTGEGGGSSPVGMRSANTSAANDDSIHVPVGYGGKRVSLTELKSRSDFKRLDSKMQQRLLNMMRENPNVGFGGGWRDTKAQEAMFLQRYRKTSKDTGIFWKGSYWERVTGAPAAPPGRSMHEIGLAADLVGDLDWMNANAARFGLKHFASVNNEPWHVQPSELPNSRSEYEKNGGSAGEWESAGESSGPVTGAPDDMPGEHGGVGFAGPRSYSGMSIQERIQQLSADAMSTFGSAPTPSRRRSGSGGGTTATSYTGSGAELAARAAYDAGFRGEDLYRIVAIAGRESGFDPRAINRASNDTGMWQIAPVNWGNMTQQQLLDPKNNAAVAFRLYQSSGFHGWKAASSRMKNDKGQWVVDPSGRGGAGWAMNGSELWNTEKYQPAARAAVDSINSSGDPMPMEASGRGTPARSTGGNTYVSSAPNITIPVEVHFHTSGGNMQYDIKTLKRDVVMALDEAARELELRGG